MSAFRTALRFLLLRRHRSKTPTGIVPLSRIRSVAVYRDPVEPSCEREIHRFFDPLGITVNIISEHDRNIRTGEDLFIAINSETCISERYAAASSTAIFKVGRRQTGKDIYDLVVSNPEDTQKGQAVAFAAIIEILKVIK